MKFSDDGITPASLASLRDAMLEQGQISRSSCPA
jgi:exopolyphosphatase/guanosine-5'-triphosphate,3'-diphosphate pyrophosphatase